MSVNLYFDWEPEFRPSGLALRERGLAEAVVVRRSRMTELAPSEHRIYDGRRNGVQVYDAEKEFKPGQVVVAEAP